MHQDIPRDRWDRPMIKNPETGKLSAMTRVSTLAKAPDDQGGLMNWFSTQTLRGLIERPDLFELARTQRNDDKQIRALAAKAKDAAASDRGANLGTMLHTWTEELDTGVTSLDVVPVDYRNMLEAYVEKTQHLELVDAELFVVNDEVQSAGTLDRLYRLPDGAVVVGDLKTGKWASSYGAGATAIQTAIYAHGKRYDPETGIRTELHPDLDMSRTLLIHMPLTDPDEAPVVELYELDGELGWYGAQLALAVQNWRKMKPVKELVLR